MVRVMSIYQYGQTIEQLSSEVSASCLIPPDHLVIAKNEEHIIEIRKLADESMSPQPLSAIPSKSFSSVDDVEQLVFSRYGNFLISVESRVSNYEKTEIRYCRVYVNWDLSTSSSSQSLRARIAGKITPMKKCE